MRERKRKREPIHTRTSFFLGSLALGILIYLGFRHLNDIDQFGQSWGKFALLQAFFCLVGLFGSTLLIEQRIFPTFRKTDINKNLNTGTRAFVILISLMITQAIIKATLSVSSSEKALYFVFAGIGEELFFRLFLIESIQKFAGYKPQSKIIAIAFSSLAFMAIHVNYYDEPTVLFSVFIGGILLAVFYLLWNDITANILAHALLNVWAVRNWLVTLTAQIAITPAIFAISFFVISLILYANREKNPKLAVIAEISILCSLFLCIGVFGSFITPLPAGPEVGP